MEVSAQSARCVEEWDVGCVDSSNLPTKKIGAPSKRLGVRLFHLSTFQTKSNPDMRNSKLAHTQAGF